MTNRRIDDAEYIQGQLAGLQAIILAVAGITMDSDVFLAEALQRIESVRTAVTFSEASDTWLDGLNDQEKWVRAVVGGEDPTG